MRVVLSTLMLILIPVVISANVISQDLEKIANRINSFIPLRQFDSHKLLLEMIKQEDSPIETHQITTEDGYILTVFRIPGLSNSQPVLLQHGLLESSVDWLLPGRGKSLAYILSENGYDVWLGNARGNTYSRSHQNLSTTDPQFWNFRYDQAAVLNYITNLTQQRLFYIGHSMGGTTFSVMAIERPDVAKKVKAAILLAPGTHGFHTNNFVKWISPFWGRFQEITDSLGIYEFLPHYSVFDYFAKYFCSNIFLNKLCEYPLFALAGSNPDKFDASLLPKIWQSFPAGTSNKLFTHYLQQKNVNAFRRFDYGPELNLKVYDNIYPPVYNLSRLRVPVAVFYSANDRTVRPEDVEQFYNEVPLKFGIFKIADTKYNHFDFLWAIDAPKLVYAKILDIMKSYNDSMDTH